MTTDNMQDNMQNTFSFFITFLPTSVEYNEYLLQLATYQYL